MKKYYCSYEGIMLIKELNETGQNNRSGHEKRTNTYCSVKLFNTIEECIKHLGSYSKVTILPDNSEVIPDMINYPSTEFYYIFKPVRFPLVESLA